MNVLEKKAKSWISSRPSTPVHSNRPTAIQILKTCKKDKLQWDMNALDKILNAPEVQDHEIAIITVAGGFRKGKSFILNYFLRYLYAKVKKIILLDTN